MSSSILLVPTYARVVGVSSVASSADTAGV